MEEIIEED